MHEIFEVLFLLQKKKHIIVKTIQLLNMHIIIILNHI